MEVIVDDFLYNLRRDSDKRNRRPSNMQQQYQGQDRRGPRDKKNYHRKAAEPDKIAEMMPEIKTLLETISANQKRRADIEERKADALEKVSLQLEAFLAGGSGLEKVIQTGTMTEDAPTPFGQSSLQTDRDEITKLVLKMRDQGKTYKEIAKYLEDEKVPTFSRKGEWHAQTIHKICKQVA
jgi:signal transduction histidine kinase